MSSSGQNAQLPPSTIPGDLTTQQTPHASSHVEANAQIGSSNYAPNDSQLAGLVEAATAAAGQQDVSEWGAAAAAAVAVAAGAAGHTHHFDGYGTHMQMEEDSFGNANYETGVGGGRHTSATDTSHETMQSSGLSRAVSRKRKRGEDPLDPALTSSMGFDGGAGDGDRQDQAHQQQPHQVFREHGLGIRSLPSQQSSPDPRAAGAHSAAALFRQPSSNKKYTRPPVSRLFTSLELSPENFLHLQAAAKAFMLDDKYPERRDCVGQRGKGDTEMVKLRLWNCVRQFLEAEGNGERFFSEHAVNEGMGPRTYVWPRDQHKIISLVIPLLRRMVTNERQRQYAIETRKPGGVEDRRRRRTVDGQAASNASSPRQHYMSEEPLRMSTPQQPEQHARHTQMLDHFNQAPAALPPPPPPPPPPQHQVAPSEHPINPGLADIFEGGPPRDLDLVAQSYDFYNRDNQLDNLWAVSGLPQPDWRGLVGAADSHYQVTHHGVPECPGPCEEHFLEQIFSSPSGADLNWRVGGRGGQGTRNEFATGITRDILRIVRDNLAASRESTAQAPNPPSGVTDAHQPSTTAQQDGHPRTGHVPSQSATAAGMSASSTPHSSISLRINILENGKRIVPRLDVLASQCPDLESLRQTILRRYTGQLPTTSPAIAANSTDTSNTTNGFSTSSEPVPSRWKVKVWLPSGVVPVHDDGEWSLALLSVTNFDWMDGDLRVLVDVGGNAGGNL